MGHIAKIFMVLTAAFAACSSTVSANWREFIPTPYENSVDLDVHTTYESDSYETDNSKAGVTRSEWTDIFVKEKLTLSSIGYVYHPRFVQYRFALSGVLKQEDYNSSLSEPVSWRNATGTEYDVNVVVLPEHPYNLRLFTRRTEPLFTEYLATQSHNVQTSRGAVFRYEKKPYFFHLKYIENSIESSLNSSDVKTFSVDGKYFKQYRNDNKFSLNGGYIHRDFTSSSLLKGVSNEYHLNNFIDLGKASLSSNLAKNIFTQEDPLAASVEHDLLSWDERLSVKLPLNFRTELSYNYQKNGFTTGATDTSSESSLSNISKRAELDIIHKLYQSLSNTYTLRRNSLASSAGDTEGTSHSLATSYNKSIPGGMLLAGLNLSRAVTDSAGQTTVANEPHASVAVPGSFVINTQFAALETVRIFLKSPIEPFELILLEENIHYIVSPFGNTFQINVINLPSQFVVPGTYEFLVTYDLTSGNFKLQMETAGYNISFNLFNHMLNPYFNHTNVRSDVLSGNFTGAPVDSTLYAAGVIFQKKPFQAMAEYQDFDSNISPYSAWRGEVSYSNNITETTRFSSTAAYSDTNYPEGRSIEQGEQLTITAASLSANIQKQFPEKNLSFSAGGAYAYTKGQINGTTYSLNSSLLWKIGRLVFSLGASAFDSITESTGADTTIRTERIHQYYYINIKRKIF
ncbi:MAG: hypothetical protein AB1499_09285 [Nitrospirota bacterium]